MMCVGRRTIDKVTKDDYPRKSPCNVCGIEKWQICFDKKESCDDLWDFLAKRGDWVIKQNE